MKGSAPRMKNVRTRFRLGMLLVCSLLQRRFNRLNLIATAIIIDSQTPAPALWGYISGQKRVSESSNRLMLTEPPSLTMTKSPVCLGRTDLPAVAAQHSTLTGYMNVVKDGIGFNYSSVSLRGRITGEGPAGIISPVPPILLANSLVYPNLCWWVTRKSQLL